jgi:hypothetical protein
LYGLLAVRDRLAVPVLMEDQRVTNEIAQWRKERDDILRSLDVEKFTAFWRKHNLPMPPEGQLSMGLSTPRRLSTTLRRLKPGWTNNSKAKRWVGRANDEMVRNCDPDGRVSARGRACD